MNIISFFFFGYLQCRTFNNNFQSTNNISIYQAVGQRVLPPFPLRNFVTHNWINYYMNLHEREMNILSVRLPICPACETTENFFAQNFCVIYLRYCGARPTNWFIHSTTKKHPYGSVADEIKFVLVTRCAAFAFSQELYHLFNSSTVDQWTKHYNNNNNKHLKLQKSTKIKCTNFK